MKRRGRPRKFTTQQVKTVLAWRTLREVADEVGLTEKQAWDLRQKPPGWITRKAKR